MLLLAVWIGAALNQSFDRFKVTGTSGFNKLIISGQSGHRLFLPPALDDRRERRGVHTVSVGISAGIADGRHAVKRVGGGLVVELGLLREGRPGIGIGAMGHEELGHGEFAVIERRAHQGPSPPVWTSEPFSIIHRAMASRVSLGGTRGTRHSATHVSGPFLP